MKTRIIQTKFWDDPFVVHAPLESRILYLYYLTCSQIGLTGVFEISDEEVQLKTGLKGSLYTKAKAYLLQSGKIKTYQSWVMVVNAARYNNYSNGEKNETALAREREMIPVEVFTGFEANSSPTDTLPPRVLGGTDSTHKPKTINQNIEIKGVVKGKFDDLTPEFVEQTAVTHGVPIPFAFVVVEKLKDYCLSTGKYYKDNQAAFRNWIKRDAVKVIQDSKVQSKSFDATTTGGKGTHDIIAI